VSPAKFFDQGLSEPFAAARPSIVRIRHPIDMRITPNRVEPHSWLGKEKAKEVGLFDQKTVAMFVDAVSTTAAYRRQEEFFGSFFQKRTASFLLAFRFVALS
jgi:hypothetical protein